MADRKASVALELKAGQFKAEATIVEAKVERVDEKVEKLDRDITKIPRDAAKAAAAMKLLGDESGKASLKLDDVGKSSTSMQTLEQRLISARMEVKRLADEFNRTGSSGSLMGMFNAQGDVKELEALQKKLTNALGAAGKTGGLQFGSAFKGGFLSGLGDLALAAAPALAPMAVLLAAELLAGVGGAISAGGGLSAIFAGSITQIKTNPAVQAAAKDLATWFVREWKADTASFAAPTTDAIKLIGTELRGPMHDLRADFEVIAPYTRDFANSLGVAAQKFMPGLNALLRNSGPLIKEAGHDVEILAEAGSRFLASVSRGGKGEAEALDTMVRALAGAIIATGKLIEWSAGLYDAFLHVARGIAYVIQNFTPFGWLIKNLVGIDLVKYIDDIGKSFDDTGPKVNALTGGMDNFAGAADGVASSLSGAAGSADVMGGAFDRLNGRSIDAAQSQIAMTRAVDDLSRSMQENGSSFDANTVKGAANLDMYIQGAQRARDHARSVKELTGSVDEANAAFQRDIDQLDATARAHGATAGAVRHLHDEYAQMPRSVVTPVTAPGLTEADRMAWSFREKLEWLNNRHFQSYVNVLISTSYSQGTSGGGAQGKASALRRWGGITRHAETGALRQASVYSTASPARYAFAEPATGGEAFVPRLGDYARSTAILDQASRWYGGRFMPGGRTNGATTNVTIYVNAGIGTSGAQVGREIADHLRPYINSQGGNVQVALGRRGQ